MDPSGRFAVASAAACLILVACVPVCHDLTASWLIASLEQYITQGQHSTAPEDDVGDLVTQIHNLGADRRALDRLMPMMTSREHRISDWSIYAAYLFSRLAPAPPDVIEAVVSIYEDPSRPKDERKGAAYILQFIDVKAAKERGIVSPYPIPAGGPLGPDAYTPPGWGAFPWDDSPSELDCESSSR